MRELPEISERKEWATAPIGEPPLNFSVLVEQRVAGFDVGLRDMDFERPIDTSAWSVDWTGPSTNARFGLGSSSGSAAGAAGAFDAEVSKTTAVPLPTAGLLGVVGLAVVGTRRRR